MAIYICRNISVRRDRRIEKKSVKIFANTLVAIYRKANITIFKMKKVIVFGSFDPLHEGHIDFFRQAKELGDYLTVVVATDENIRRLKDRDPDDGEGQRLEAVAKIDTVDRAILGDKDRYGQTLENEKPDIIAVGYDQSMPQELKNDLKKYTIVTLKPYKPEVFKSSKIRE